MTWQYIDENTYIDDTLVTSAEYQLFIDDMRKKGKWYQPDHWTANKFPDGQAREPITGVRRSDAKAFFEWLKPRKGEEWKYRLPFQSESLHYPVMFPVHSPVGYWIMRDQDKDDFTWVRTIPKDARKTNIYGLHQAHDHARDIYTGHYEILDRWQVLRKAIDRKRRGSITIDHALALYGRALDHYYGHTRGLTDSLDNELHYALDDSLTRPIDLELANIADGNLSHDIAQSLYYGGDPDTSKILYSIIDIFIDIYTLQERIAGRSPAFEGIRLVKERIR